MDMLLTLDITGLNLEIQLDGVISRLTEYMNSTLIMIKDDNGKCRIETHRKTRVHMDFGTKEKVYESKPYSCLVYDLNTVNQIMNLYPATRYTTGKSNKPLKWWLIELMNIQCTALRAKLLLENKGKDTEVPYDYFVAHATVMEIYRRQDRMNISTRVYDTNGKGEREDPYGILHIHNCSDEDCTITVLKRNDEADRRQSIYERAIADSKLMLKIDNLPILEYLAYQATKATSKDTLDEFTHKLAIVAYYSYSVFAEYANLDLSKDLDSKNIGVPKFYDAEYIDFEDEFNQIISEVKQQPDYKQLFETIITEPDAIDNWCTKKADKEESEGSTEGSASKDNGDSASKDNGGKPEKPASTDSKASVPKKKSTTATKKKSAPKKKE
jgi:hypothetical protein